MINTCKRWFFKYFALRFQAYLWFLGCLKVELKFSFQAHTIATIKIRLKAFLFNEAYI